MSDTDLAAIARRILEADAKATPAPWGCDYHIRDDGTGVDGWVYSVAPEGLLCAKDNDESANLPLIALARNHAPELARAYLKQQEENRHLLGMLADSVDSVGTLLRRIEALVGFSEEQALSWHAVRKHNGAFKDCPQKTCTIVRKAHREALALAQDAPSAGKGA